MLRIVVVYSVQLFVVWLLTLALLISNPLTMNDETAKHLLVPNNIWPTRLIAPQGGRQRATIEAVTYSRNPPQQPGIPLLCVTTTKEPTDGYNKYRNYKTSF